MYRVNESTVIASVTDLRRRTSEVLAAGEEGADVIVQKGDNPEGVYMSFERYRSVMERLNRLESLELAELAVQRKLAIERGEASTLSLEEMLRRHAPELLAEAGYLR